MIDTNAKCWKIYHFYISVLFITCAVWARILLLLNHITCWREEENFKHSTWVLFTTTQKTLDCLINIRYYWIEVCVWKQWLVPFWFFSSNTKVGIEMLYQGIESNKHIHFEVYSLWPFPARANTSTNPLLRPKKNPSISKLIKRRQWRHTWLNVLIVKLSALNILLYKGMVLFLHDVLDNRNLKASIILKIKCHYVIRL